VSAASPAPSPQPLNLINLPNGAPTTGLLPSLILVVNPAIQYALFEWGMQKAQGAKARRAAAGGAVAARAPKLTTMEVFYIGGRTACRRWGRLVDGYMHVSSSPP
jgi:hypothetical protein